MSEEYEGYPTETGQYTLEADENALDVIYGVENNVLWSCSMYVTNGSVAVDLAFRDGVFSGLIDHRQLYSIGDTTVNVSMRQAIEIAIKRVENYSYYMGNGIWISDFNVMGTSATLISQEARLVG
jgi:hypothetical protein